MPRRKPSPRAWNEHNDQEWMTQVTATFKQHHDASDTVTYRGLCPVCLDEITVELPRPHYSVFEVGSDTVGAPIETPFTARHWCNCAGDHPGRPTGRSGCGVYGYASADRADRQLSLRRTETAER